MVSEKMDVLLQSLPEVESHFGKKAMMASNLLDMVNEGERAFGFLLGSMDNGFDVTVGFFKDKARYAAFKKRTASRWNESDIRDSEADRAMVELVLQSWLRLL